MSTKDPNSRSLLSELETHVDTSGRLTVLYDGECPFCSRYVAMVKLRENVGAVTLVNAREKLECVEVLSRHGININNGMVVIWDNKIFYGADAMHLLAMLSADSGLFSMVNRLVFKNKGAAKTIYPALVAGRRMTLWGLRRSMISTNQT